MKVRKSLHVFIASFFFMLMFLPGYSSADPLDSWHLRTSGTTEWLYGVTYANNTFVAVGYGTILTSPDGATWTDRSSGYSLFWFRGVAYGNGIFVAVGHEGTILTSPDGVTWTNRSLGYGSFRGVAYAQYEGIFVAVGASGIIITSPDGATWTARSSGTLSELQGVAYGQGTFVAVGENGTILTSPTGEIWTPRLPPITLASLNGIIYTEPCSGGYVYPKFVAVGEGGTILTSFDGSYWTESTSGTTYTLYGVTTYTRHFVAVGDIGTILTSDDGETWSARTSGTYDRLFGATYGNTYVAVGINGSILQSDPFSQTFDFSCRNEGWRALGLFDDLGLDPIPGWFVDVPAPWSNVDGDPIPGVIGVGTYTPTQFPPSPTGALVLHADLWSPDLSFYDEWQNMSSFSYSVTGNWIMTDQPIWVTAVLWGKQPDGSIAYFSDGQFYDVPTWPAGNWATYTVDVTALEVPPGTIITNVELGFVFLPSSWVNGFVLVDHVVPAWLPPPPQTSLSVSPTSAPPGGTVTATWSGIASPTATDWIGLYSPEAGNTGYIDWIYVSCSQVPGSGQADGSCSFVIPSSLADGTYEFRLFANDGFTLLATSNTLTVQ